MQRILTTPWRGVIWTESVRSTGHLLALVSFLVSCAPDRKDEAVSLSGKELAERYCQGCHALPDPDMLDRETWRTGVLPAMGHRLGIYEREGLREDSLIEPGLAGQLLLQAGIYPETPVISGAAWKKLVEYYISQAPQQLPSQPPREITAQLPHFRVRMPAFRTDPPMTTLVKIDPKGGRIYVGDTKQDFSTLEILNRDAEPVQTIGLESAPSHLRIAGDSLYLLLMGRLLPTDNPAGLLRNLFRQPGEEQISGALRLKDRLFRPVYASYADLNEDGREDVVVSEFGHHIGRLAWYEQTADRSYLQHTLRPLPGASVTFARDVNRDGRLDILALVGQGDEGVFLYENQGEGHFREERLLRFPPSYGSTWMDLQDFNGDGHFDILYINGDNGDFSPIAKPYHGVRIFLNNGHNRFVERFFFPLYGAFQARTRDYDGDGDFDIAVIAFYPEYRNPPAQGFVYLENKGGLSFEASTFPEADRGRWITLDAGDLDQDGDDDIVLGSFVAFDPLNDTTGLWNRWLREGPSILILENTHR